MNTAAAPAPPTAMRLDKWLWAARWYKTRALAHEAIVKGRVEVDGAHAKPGRDVRAGSRLRIHQQPGMPAREVEVLALAAVRGPAAVAQTLWAETAASVASMHAALQARRDGVEPALAQAHGRPTKRDRRELAQWERWSARPRDD